MSIEASRACMAFVSTPITAPLRVIHSSGDSWSSLAMGAKVRRSALPQGLPWRLSGHAAKDRTMISPLMATWAETRTRFASAIFGMDKDEADGTLWWQDGAAVQSLNIACRDSSGHELDPWRLSELLMDVGAMSVTVDDASQGTEAEVPVLHHHPSSKAFDSRVPAPSAVGRKDMWGGSSRVVALFPASWDLAGVVSAVQEVFELPSPLEFKVDGVIDKDWVLAVQRDWDPIEVGRLRIRFPWHEPLLPSKLRPAQVDLELEGGRAFGTGEHPTTSMCCSWLEGAALRGKRVLDYGSGSGILGLAALAFGAKEAVGIEVDLSSIASAAGNAARNGFTMDTYHPQEVGTGEELDLILTKVRVLPRDDDGGGEARFLQGSGAEPTEPVVNAQGPAIPSRDLGTFDVTVANILVAPIVRLQPILAKLTAPGGMLALSGVLVEQAEAVVDAFKEAFDLRVTETMGGWVLISGVRRDS